MTVVESIHATMPTRYHKGFPMRIWEKSSGKRNEALDCRVYATAALHILNPDLEALTNKMLVTKPQVKEENTELVSYIPIKKPISSGFVSNW